MCESFVVVFRRSSRTHNGQNVVCSNAIFGKKLVDAFVVSFLRAIAMDTHMMDDCRSVGDGIQC